MTLTLIYCRCEQCLHNRYGVIKTEVDVTVWTCPVCNKNCNCSLCRKKVIRVRGGSEREVQLIVFMQSTIEAWLAKTINHIVRTILPSAQQNRYWVKDRERYLILSDFHGNPFTFYGC